jgi:thioredoxin 1
MALEFTDKNFEELVLKSDKPVLVDFWATWCGPCRAIAPVIDELHEELEGKALIGKVNIDENSDVPVTYGVRNIPTLLVFKNGQIVETLVGNQPKSTLVELLESHI